MSQTMKHIEKRGREMVKSKEGNNEVNMVWFMNGACKDSFFKTTIQNIYIFINRNTDEHKYGTSWCCKSCKAFDTPSLRLNPTSYRSSSPADSNVLTIGSSHLSGRTPRNP
jgi:hypothetical protein